MKGIFLRQPATSWQDALPLGNGSVGAMVYGNIRHELVLLNHEALWLRTPKRELPSVAEYLPELRSMLAEDRYQEGSKFLYAKMQEKGYEAQSVNPYHPAFDLGIEMDVPGAFSHYRRSLYLETGEACVKWTVGARTWERRMFVSRADDMAVMRISCDHHASVGCAVKLFCHAWAGVGGMFSPEVVRLPDLPLTFERSADGEWVTIVGRYDDGNEFGGLARVAAVSGTLETAEGQVRVKVADKVLILLKLFANERSTIALERLRAELSALDADYDVLFDRHAPLHQELFDRVRLDLNAGEERDAPNEDLLMEAYDGNVEAALVERMFDYGRYLLICSSRPGGLPANLQGVWNGSYKPAWESDYHNDWNIQINYWQALPANMRETALPFFDYYESFLEDYRNNALALFGCRGILLPLAQSTHGVMYAGNPRGKWAGIWINWTAGAGWLAQLFYDYWLFTGDRDFLAERAVPWMREVALFYEDFVFEDTQGRWVFSPSHSPENIPSSPGAARIQVNATMDVAVAKEVLTNLSAACEELGIEEEGVRRWREMLKKMPDYEVNEDGAMREWVRTDLADQYEHMHFPHIYPLFPGLEIIPETDPALCEAIRTAIDKRFEFGLTTFSCESFTHAACAYARLQDGDRAQECLDLLIRTCTLPNLLTCVNDWRGQGCSFFDSRTGYDGTCQPFQVDGNLGFTAAVLEMLVYSKPGIVKLLPALPTKWLKGKAEGILCRGGIEVGIEWDMAEGCVVAALFSRTEQEVTVMFPGNIASLDCDSAQVYDSDYGRAYKRLALPTGVKVVLRAVVSKGK